MYSGKYQDTNKMGGLKPVVLCILRSTLRWIGAGTTSKPSRPDAANVSHHYASRARCCVPFRGHVTVTSHGIGFDGCLASSAIHRKVKWGRAILVRKKTNSISSFSLVGGLEETFRLN